MLVVVIWTDSRAQRLEKKEERRKLWREFLMITKEDHNNDEIDTCF